MSSRCDEDASNHMLDEWSFCVYCGKFLTWAERVELHLT